MNKVAFLTTVFPMNIDYLKDMLDSLVKQTVKEFDLVVVNDGLEEFSRFIKDYNEKLNIVELTSIKSPAKNREMGINFCIKEGYEFLVFGDSDDYFSNNRIEKSVELLGSFDIVVNDLTLFEKDEVLEDKYLSNRLDNRVTVDFDFIKNKNIFGLSNTAISLKGLSFVDIPESLIVVDWYFFSVLLLNRKKAIFTNETITYYRQYAGNLVGLKDLSKESHVRGLNVKKIHYNALKQLTNKIDEEVEFYNNAHSFSKTSEIAYPLWWELI